MWIHDALDAAGLPHPMYSPTAWLVIALSAPVVLIVAYPIHKAAIRNLKHPTMDNLISMGTLAAFGGRSTPTQLVPAMCTPKLQQGLSSL